MSNKLSYKFSYQRRLPHIQPEGATFFVTSRLAGSLPAQVVAQLTEERERFNGELTKIKDNKERTEQAYLISRKLFGKWDDELDKSTRVNYLADPRVADLITDSLHYRDSKVFELIAFCLMPNHTHVVFTPLEESKDKYFSLSRIMHSLKRHTARNANLILGRKGIFWQHENYDHVVRDDGELERMVKYVLNNPVKANLVQEQTNWKWSYSKYDM
jgi:REP element-mobilizing transposase RayT